MQFKSYFCHCLHSVFFTPSCFPWSLPLCLSFSTQHQNILHPKGFFLFQFLSFSFMLDRSYSWHNSNSLFWFQFSDYHDLHNKAQELGQGFFFWVWRTALYFNIIGFSYKHRQFVLCIYKLHAEKRPIGFSKLPKKPMMQSTYWRNSESKEKEGGNWKCLLVFIPSFFLHSFFVSESH